ncbi:LysR family transcriptional regulator [Pseudomonas sp.]|uniref:LysR family transcriptional regulator n=1 Tax=Pseudomonas sp. TaxID=306 RepID=UPI0028A9CD89|nr:LysR family transcriptional regulator [Pseudomonas sp.]
MNIKFLETFIWVARLGSFRLAAQKLFSTQAAVSNRIAALEDELGVRLFERDARGATVTPRGQALIRYAEQVLDSTQALRQAVDAAQPGRVRVGVMESVIHTWLAPFIQRIGVSHPGLELDLQADTARNLAEQLRRGQLDLILQTDPLPDEGVRNAHLASYPMAWLARHTHHGCAASLAMLAQQRLITFSRHSRPHQDLLGLLHAHGLHAPRLCCINSVAAIERLLAEDFGIAALPPALVSAALRDGTLRRLDLQPVPADLEMFATWRIGAGLETVQSLVDSARAAAVAHAADLPAGYVNLR